MKKYYDDDDDELENFLGDEDEEREEKESSKASSQKKSLKNTSDEDEEDDEDPFDMFDESSHSLFLDEDDEDELTSLSSSSKSPGAVNTQSAGSENQQSLQTPLKSDTESTEQELHSDSNESTPSELSTPLSTSSPVENRLQSESNAKLAPIKEAEVKRGEIPVNVSVEIARLKLTAKDVMNLAPGNILNMQVPPEKGVNLVVNGKNVGTGELVQIGDVLGIRVVKIND
ncbi:MAG: putative flagellar motor switch protein [Chlamydiales bacterium]|jgi:flagellar motor switch protein FliN/FliY|nr:putative flagellar motor switch protein [Chlamydiales bacterium]